MILHVIQHRWMYYNKKRSIEMHVYIFDLLLYSYSHIIITKDFDTSICSMRTLNLNYMRNSNIHLSGFPPCLKRYRYSGVSLRLCNSYYAYTFGDLVRKWREIDHRVVLKQTRDLVLLLLFCFYAQLIYKNIICL